MAKTSKAEIYKDKGGEFRVRLLAPNGESVATSEGYKSKASAKNWITKLAKWAGEAEVEDQTKK